MLSEKMVIQLIEKLFYLQLLKLTELKMYLSLYISFITDKRFRSVIRQVNSILSKVDIFKSLREWSMSEWTIFKRKRWRRL